MTQEQALEALVAMYPTTKKHHLSVDRDRALHADGRVLNNYYLWNRDLGSSSIIASSDRSWEHALAIAKSGNEDIWDMVDEPTEEVAS